MTLHVLPRFLTFSPKSFCPSAYDLAGPSSANHILSAGTDQAPSSGTNLSREGPGWVFDDKFIKDHVHEKIGKISKFCENSFLVGN